MSIVLLNIVAYLAILALLGLFVVLFMMVQNGLVIVRTGKGAIRLIDPPKNSIKGTIKVVKGYGLQYKERGQSIVNHGKAAMHSAVNVKDDITGAIKSVDFASVASGARETVDNVKQTAKAASFFQQVVETYRQAQAANEAVE